MAFGWIAVVFGGSSYEKNPKHCVANKTKNPKVRKSRNKKQNIYKHFQWFNESKSIPTRFERKKIIEINLILFPQGFFFMFLKKISELLEQKFLRSITSSTFFTFQNEFWKSKWIEVKKKKKKLQITITIIKRHTFVPA